MQSVLDSNSVLRARGSFDLVRAADLSSCTHPQCISERREFSPSDAVHGIIVDTPLSGPDSPTAVLMWHAACWKQWEAVDSLRYASLRVQLPGEVVAQEQQAGRDANTTLVRDAPSALAVTKGYLLVCPRLEVRYAAPDTPTLFSWVLSVPSAALATVPVHETVFNERTFAGLFRYRTTLVVGYDPSLSRKKLDKNVVEVLKTAMEQALSTEWVHAFKVAEDERMVAVGDYCASAVFRHDHKAPDASNRLYNKLVIELVVPPEKLGALLLMFKKCFLSPDTAETDKLSYAEVFQDPIAKKDATVSGRHEARLWEDRYSWAVKLSQRRSFLLNVMDDVVTRLTDKLKKGGSVAREAAGSYFANSWTANVVEVEAADESARWEYLVNCQSVRTFDGIKDLGELTYVVSEDLTSLQCFRSDSAVGKQNRYEQLPCVWGGKPELLRDALKVRQFEAVDDVNTEQLWGPSITTKK